MDDELIVVLSGLLNLEHNQDHLLEPVRKLEAVGAKDTRELQRERRREGGGGRTGSSS